MHARTTGDGAEAQTLAGIEIVGDMRARLDQPPHQQRVGLRRRRGRALQHEAQFRSATPQPQRRDHQEGRDRGEDRVDGGRVPRLLQPLKARRRPQLGPGELDPGDQQPERLPPGCRCRRIEPVRQLRHARNEPRRRLGGGRAAAEHRALQLRLPQPRGHRPADGGLDLARGDAPAGGARGDAAVDETGADIVAIAPALAAGMARPHLPALGIEEPTGQRARGACRVRHASAPPVGGQLLLHRLPERRLHDRGVLAGMDLVPVPDAADEERVGEQGVEPAAGEGGAAAAASAPMQPFRGADAGGIELGLQLADRAERKVAREIRRTRSASSGAGCRLRASVR